MTETPSPLRAFLTPKTIGALSAFLCLVVLVVWVIRRGGSESPASETASAVTAPAPVASLSPEQRQQAYNAGLSAVRSRSTRLQALVDGFPRELVDVDALARSLTTPEAAFAYVRDGIALEPYAGIMKGAAGTLVSRGGNSVDRALLLAAILSANGVTARIVRGTLPEAQVAALLQQIADTPGAVAHIARTLPKTLPVSSVSDAGRRSIEALQAQADARARTHRVESEASVATVRAVLEKSGFSIGLNRNATQVKALQDHFWVQASIGAATIDLDPSLTTAAMNQRIAEPAETYAADRLPETLHHRIGIRIVADMLEGARVSTKEVLRTDANAVDLFNQNVRVAVAPQNIARNQNTYQAEVTLGRAPAVVKTFQIRPVPGSATPARGGAGGLLGAFGAGPEPTPEAAAVLGRLSVEVISNAPLLGETRYRRVVVDRLEGDTGEPRLQSGTDDDDSVRMLLLQVWDGAIDVGAVHPLHVFMRELEAIKAEQAMTELALAAKYLDQPFTAESLAAGHLPPKLVSFFFYSGLTHDLIAAENAPRVREYHLRPRLAFFRHGVVVHDWSKPGVSRRFQDSIDLVSEPYGFVGPHDDAITLGLKVGVADTALERAFAKKGGDFNTVPLFTAAGDQKIAVSAAGSGQESAVEQLPVPAAIRGVLRGEMALGRTLVLPARLVELNDVRTFGWWTLDPESGVPLGQMELGAGQGAVESSALTEKVMEMSHVIFKFYGGLLGCFYTEAADQLVAPTGPYTVVNLPLLPKIKGGSHLGACVAGKICEAIVEYALLAAGTAVHHVKAEAEHAVAQLLLMLGKMVFEEQVAEGVCHGLESGGH